MFQLTWWHGCLHKLLTVHQPPNTKLASNYMDTTRRLSIAVWRVCAFLHIGIDIKILLLRTVRCENFMQTDQYLLVSVACICRVGRRRRDCDYYQYSAIVDNWWDLWIQQIWLLICNGRWLKKGIIRQQYYRLRVTSCSQIAVRAILNKNKKKLVLNDWYLYCS